MTPQEKIRQFVIMARHDEAKSCEEALEMENSYSNCQYDWTKTSHKIFIKNGSKMIMKYCKILGRPITALDVCWALNKKTGEFDFGIERFYILNN